MLTFGSSSSTSFTFFSVIEAYLFLILGFVLLIGGAEILVRGSTSIALRLGLSPMIIGLTLVAFGTSSPELVVSLNAAFQGTGDISLGNVIGSNISNIGLILGITAIILPISVRSKLIRVDMPIMIYVSLLLLFFLRDLILNRWEGLVLFGSLIAYLIFSFMKANQEKDEDVLKEFTEEVHETKGSLFTDALMAVGGIAALVFGSNWLVDSSVNIARTWGVSEAVIGLTLVAIGTSLPELATGIVAAIKKEADIVMGNIIGSNIFNILAILGLTSIIIPVEGKAITSLDLGAMMLFSVVLLPMMWRGKQISRLAGILLLFLYFLYVYLLLA